MHKPIIFDTSIFIHANFAIQSRIKEVVTSEEIARKVISQINKIAFVQFPARPIILALDSEDLFRKKIFEGYKGKRDKKRFNREEIHQIILEEGYMYLQLDGLEADDICYIVSEKYPGTTIISEDGDLRPCLQNPGTELYRYKLQQLVELTEQEIVLEELLKITGGCKSDKVPPIKLKKFGKKYLTELIEQHPNLTTENLLDVLKESGYIESWLQNYQLVVYRYPTYRKYLGEAFETFYKNI